MFLVRVNFELSIENNLFIDQMEQNISQFQGAVWPIIY